MRTILRPPVMTHTARRLVSTALLSIVPLALGSCFALARNAPPQRQYVLSGTRTPMAGPVGVDTLGLSIGIRRIDLAPYLKSPDIIIRRGTHEIIASQYHRWGEDLGEGINYSIAAHLTNAPPVKVVNVAPWAARAHHDFLLQLHVSRFEGLADSAAATGAIHVFAIWDIIRPLDGVVLVRGITDYHGGHFTVGDYESLVGELNTALARVASDVRTCLAQLRTDALPLRSCSAVGPTPTGPAG